MTYFYVIEHVTNIANKTTIFFLLLDVRIAVSFFKMILTFFYHVVQILISFMSVSECFEKILALWDLKIDGINKLYDKRNVLIRITQEYLC